MFSNFTIALLLGLGFGAWIYGKTMRSNGGLTKRALTVAAIAALVAFILMITLLSLLFHHK